GCTSGCGMFRMHFVPNLLRQAAALPYQPVGQVIPSDNPGTFSLGVRRPAGVVGAIAPWNAALILSARSLASPLALGNSVVLKPSELSPVVGGTLWGEILTEAGLPAGVLNVVTHAPGEAGAIGDALAVNNAVRRINFTGSTVIGPLINEHALQTVKSRVDDAVAKGARVLAGGEAAGTCYQATLLTDVPEDSDFARIETFGPVASIELVDGAEEAIARANATAYGLASGIITSDPERGFALAQQLDAGIVHVNDQPVGDEPQMPFGGVKDSGFGRFGGQAAIDELTELRWITIQSGTHPFPF